MECEVPDLGIARDYYGKSAEVDAMIDQAVAVMKRLGATLSISRSRILGNTTMLRTQFCSMNLRTVWRSIFGPWGGVPDPRRPDQIQQRECCEGDAVL